MSGINKLLLKTRVLSIDRLIFMRKSQISLAIPKPHSVFLELMYPPSQFLFMLIQWNWELNNSSISFSVNFWVCLAASSLPTVRSGHSFFQNAFSMYGFNYCNNSFILTIHFAVSKFLQYCITYHIMISLHWVKYDLEGWSNVIKLKGLDYFLVHGLE